MTLPAHQSTPDFDEWGLKAFTTTRAAGITARAIDWFAASGFAASSLRLHPGPAICGSCYEVSPDVYSALTGSTVERPAAVDFRAAIPHRALRRGVRSIAVSERWTRCSNDQRFSHRAGDDGRQLGVLFSPR